MRRPAARATRSSPPLPATPRRGRPTKALAAKRESTEVAYAGIEIDHRQRRMADEFGELDRQLQIFKPEMERYDALKRAIKSWFDRLPPEVDGIVEGAVYRLHLSARERERRVRSMRDLVETVGLDKFLELASVPIGALEDLLGKTRAASLVTEARTGSRRIKAVPKRPAAGEN